MLAGKQSAKVRLPQKAGANGAKLAAESKFGTILIPERQHSTAQHSTAQHSTAQHSTAQHSCYSVQHWHASCVKQTNWKSGMTQDLVHRT